MNIGLIGAGFVGRAVAALAVKAGHRVMASNSREPETLFSFVGMTGRGCKAGTAEQAAAFGELVIVAIPFSAISSLPLTALRGKIVIDANNYYAARDGAYASIDAGEKSSSELLAALLPESSVVKAFNAIISSELVPDSRPAGARDRRALPIAGDNTAAKRVVTELHNQFGYDIVDAGPLPEGWRFEPGTPAYCSRNGIAELEAALDAAGAR